MTFTAIVVSCANPNGLRKMLGNLRYQTRPPDETLVFCADTPDVARLREEFQDVEFLERPRQGDWGHTDRAEGLERATGDWIGFFNDDDSYARRYVELMLEASIGNDAVYCQWNRIPLNDNVDESFRLCRSTSGNFIVKRQLALKIGYPEDKVYEADGHFIERVREHALGIGYVPVLLYAHNHQP